MNDDAKFFFFLSGFFGFIFFYAFSIFLYRDAINSLVYGAIGSVFFSLLGRSLLISALRKVQTSRAKTEDQSNPEQTANDSREGSRIEKEQSPLDSSLKANQEAATADSQKIHSLTPKK